MEFGSSKLDTSIRSEYMEQVLGQLKRFGIPNDMVRVEIGEAGLSEDGHPMFHAMLRIDAWQRKPGVRLLLVSADRTDRPAPRVEHGWLAGRGAADGVVAAHGAEDDAAGPAAA